MTARSVLLPGDDANELAARRREMLDDLQPRNRLETTLIVRIADDVWIADRCQDASLARASFRIRHEPLEQAKTEKEDALVLGDHLFWNPARPLPFDRGDIASSLGLPPVIDFAVHPYHPARVLLRLEQTIPGCDWLLDRWAQLNRRIKADETWLLSDAFKMVRLVGKHAWDMDEDFDVTRMLLCSLTLIQAPKAAPEQKPSDWPLALTRMLASFEIEGQDRFIDNMVAQFKSFTHRLAQLPLARMAPEGVEQASEWLKTVINGEIERVGQIRAMLQGIADADAAEAPARLAFDTGPEGENDRRYLLSSKRVLNQSIGKFLNARKMSETGAFDYVDLDQDDLINPDDPHDIENRPGSDSSGDSGDSQSVEAEADGILNHQNGRCDTLAEARPVDVSGKTPAPMLETAMSCDDDQILRNEANSSEKASEWIWAKVAELAPMRAEELRKLNEESRKEAEGAEAVGRSCRGGHQSGKTGHPRREPATRTEPRRKRGNGERKEQDWSSS